MNVCSSRDQASVFSLDYEIHHLNAVVAGFAEDGVRILRRNPLGFRLTCWIHAEHNILVVLNRYSPPYVFSKPNCGGYSLGVSCKIAHIDVG